MTDVEALTTPVDVLYCGACGMPPEYCEYGPDFESHCNPWLLKTHPDVHAKLKALRGADSKAAAAAGSGDEDASDDDEEGPTEPWTTEERLTAFYEKYQPDKVGDVPKLLDKYEGKYDKLFSALVKKYGPEPEDPYITANYGADSDSDDDGAVGDMAGLSLEDKKERKKRRRERRAEEAAMALGGSVAAAASAGESTSAAAPSHLRTKAKSVSSLSYTRDDAVALGKGEWVNDGLGGIFDSEGYTGRKQEGTGKIYKAHLFNKKGFGTTPDCPFDCDCCYI